MTKETKEMPVLCLDDLYRFWMKVDVKSKEECWLWTAGIASHGYGDFRVKSTNYLAHRISYWIFSNEDPGILRVCHECNTRLCVNPHHLWLGTDSENTQHRYDSGNTGRSLLNEQIVREIRDSTETGRALAKRFAVSEALISQVKNRKLWNHI